ncbi:MAG: hypothetical protein KC546_01950 [Anaerolineae bacterium]|nr:hypothetical protein [Anaerolineae bacterium]MCA9887098.1 hypothetical protein [Anaerolineae bacterium]MCA9894468.1 hypothetical protein [Anaerolineae bacterium]
MIYGRKTQQTYPGRGVVLAVQALLILGIAYFGIEALANIFDKAAPSADVTYVITTRSAATENAETNALSHEEIANYYYNVGVDYLHHYGEPALALVNFNRAQALNPYDPSYDLAIGIAYEQMNMYSRAAAEYVDWMRGIEQFYVPVSWEDGITQSLRMSDGGIFAFTVDADAGQSLSVTAESEILDQVDTLVVVLDPYGTPVVGDDDLNDGYIIRSLASYINDYSVPTSGEYTVLVSHAGAGSNGVIDVTVDLD